MSKFFKLSIFASVLAIAIVFAFSPSPVQADSDTFNLDVFHNINGRSLGLDKELPVDVYANGELMLSPSASETASRCNCQPLNISSKSNWLGRTPS
jgi:hypothetical protein